MSLSLLLAHLGSLFLGVTLTFTILFNAAGRHGHSSSIDSLVMGLFCFLGLCVAMSCYLGALTLAG